MLFNALSLALLPLAALAAPLVARQTNSTPIPASGSVTVPTSSTSVIRGRTGALQVVYTPGPETAWVDVELLYRTQDDDDDDDDDDIETKTLVEDWAPNPNNATAPLEGFFRLLDDDFELDGDDDVPCDGAVQLRVTEHQLDGNRDRSVRLPLVDLTLACEAASA